MIKRLICKIFGHRWWKMVGDIPEGYYKCIRCREEKQIIDLN